MLSVQKFVEVSDVTRIFPTRRARCERWTACPSSAAYVLLTLAKDYGGLDPVKPHAEYYTNEFFDCKQRGSGRRASRPRGPEYV